VAAANVRFPPIPAICDDRELVAVFYAPNAAIVAEPNKLICVALAAQTVAATIGKLVYFVPHSLSFTAVTRSSWVEQQMQHWIESRCQLQVALKLGFVDCLAVP
jgi:hypothetical protein